MLEAKDVKLKINPAGLGLYCTMCAVIRLQDTGITGSVYSVCQPTDQVILVYAASLGSSLKQNRSPLT